MKLIISNGIKGEKKKIWTNNQRLINKKEALIRAYRKLSPRHELISFVWENFILEKLISIKMYKYRSVI